MDIIKGRGSASQPHARFDAWQRNAFADGWEASPQPLPATEVRMETARTILSRNDTPDIPFRYSINPYRGCEHGCIYCYARPSHTYVNLSPGLDFETKLYAKANAAQALCAELARPGYRPSPINLGGNTDPYQPIERRWRLTRQILEVLLEHRHPCMLVTKGAAVERDLDVLAELARHRLVHVFLSLATLDGELARRLEPRAAAPRLRLRLLRLLSEAGIPCGVLVAPIIPGLTDAGLEDVLKAAGEAGASRADYVLLRLPGEVGGLFTDWLKQHYPLQSARVMGLIRQCRGEHENDARFFSRMVGEGQVARMLAQRVRIARRRHGLDRPLPALDLSAFRVPKVQGELF